MKLLIFLMFFGRQKITVSDTVTTDKPGGYFIAMQYKGLSNCIYKVFVTDSLLLCAKVNGYITVQPNFGIGTSVPKSLMHNPEAYVNGKMDAKYTAALLADHQKFLKTDRQNFIIAKSDIQQLYHDPTKKWGMGYYPHNGKILIRMNSKTTFLAMVFEFILVGDQDAQAVLKMINLKTGK